MKRLTVSDLSDSFPLRKLRDKESIQGFYNWNRGIEMYACIIPIRLDYFSRATLIRMRTFE